MILILFILSNIGWVIYKKSDHQKLISYIMNRMGMGYLCYLIVLQKTILSSKGPS
jgi:hypothetical protein